MITIGDVCIVSRRPGTTQPLKSVLNRGIVQREVKIVCQHIDSGDSQCRIDYLESSDKSSARLLYRLYGVNGQRSV